jgi:hypothetical protein
MSNFIITNQDDAYDYIENGVELYTKEWRWGLHKTYLIKRDEMHYLATFTFGQGDDSGLLWSGHGYGNVKAEEAESFQVTFTSWRVKK